MSGLKGYKKGMQDNTIFVDLKKNFNHGIEEPPAATTEVSGEENHLAEQSSGQVSKWTREQVDK